MCGIVGYIGEKNCVPILVEGLKRLEYRGYDSSGISIIYRNKLKTFKKTGKITAMESILPDNLKANIGIGHTRWATHGRVNDINAHPHISQNGKFSIIHNGIIENYTYLKNKLIEDGFTFQTETDSEVIALLMKNIMKIISKMHFIKRYSNLKGLTGLLLYVNMNPNI